MQEKWKPIKITCSDNTSLLINGFSIVSINCGKNVDQKTFIHHAIIKMSNNDIHDVIDPYYEMWENDIHIDG